MFLDKNIFLLPLLSNCKESSGKHLHRNRIRIYMSREVLLEIWASMKHNKSRIVLTGFSTCWGMFILIILLGTGNGVMRGVNYTFRNVITNTVTLTPGKTALPWNGNAKNVNIDLRWHDMQRMQMQFKENIAEVHPFIRIKAMVSHLNDYKMSPVSGTNPNYMPSKRIEPLAGRDINPTDIKLRRKVCVLEETVARTLFRGNRTMGIGQYATINGVPFLVVGIYKRMHSYTIAHDVFIPMTTMVSLWASEGNYTGVAMVVTGINTKAENDMFMTRLRQYLANIKNYSPDDNRAVYIDGTFEFSNLILTALYVLNIFTWVVGIATLLTGIVGISNIMLIAVKERTREFGVRRALGAKKRDIVRLVMSESVIISVVFGYVGILVALGLMQLVNIVIAKLMAGQSTVLIGEMSVDMKLVVVANLMMLIAGLIAGYMPARHAVRINVVQALTSD